MLRTWALAGFALGLAARTALADEAPAAPATSEARSPAGPMVVFELPRLWPEEPGETWTLADSAGRLVCQLPCSVRVPQSSGYRLVGLTPGNVIQMPLPDDLATEGPFARIRREVDPSTTLWAHVHPARGSTEGAIALGVVSCVVVAIGLGFSVAILVAPCSGDACAGKFIVFPALGVAGLGAIGGAAALAWGAYSRGPGLELSRDPPSTPRTSGVSRVPVALSWSGVVGSF